MSELVLTAEETACLAEGGYTIRDMDGRKVRLVHESYDRPFPHPADGHIGLSAAEVDTVARMPEGLTVGDTIIRSEVAR